MKKIYILLAVIVIALVGIIGMFVMRKPKPINVPVIPVAQATVTITKTGFVPATIKIKKGQQVTWTNTDTKDHQVSADPHPSHSSLPNLSETSKILPQESMSFTFEKTGTYGYHDELNPLTLKGTVIVE